MKRGKGAGARESLFGPLFLVTGTLSIGRKLDMPTLGEIEAALKGAASSHHEFEKVYLKGAPDENWPVYYAAFVLGRLANLDIAPSKLTALLHGVSADDWTVETAKAIRAASPKSP